MKSLKRTLSLVLALVMVLGMFGVAGAVDFTDDAAVQYKEAVDVITGIGAITGYPDGSFGPTGTITRAEAAKMVAYTVLGADVAKSLAGTASSFTDVTSPAYDWAIPSIEYLVKEGAINGRGNGIFDPSATVTGYEMGKMLLCALGHGALDEYVGTGWDLNVAIEANKNDIYVGRVAGSASLDKPATREEAALYCFNTLQQNYVAYNKLTGVYGDDTTAETIGKDVYNLADPEIVYIAENDATGIATPGYTKAYVATVNENDGTIDAYAASATAYEYVTGADMIGKLVKVYKSTAGKVYAMVEVGTYVTVAAPGITTDATKMTAAFGATYPTEVSKLAVTKANGTYQYNESGLGLYDASAKTAGAGTYVIYKGEVVGFNQPLASDVTPVVITVTDAAKGYYKVGTAGDDDLYALKTATAANNYDKAATAIDWLSLVKTGETSATAAYIVSQFGNKYSFAEPATLTGKVTLQNTNTVYVDGVKKTTAWVEADAKAMFGTTAAIYAAGSLDYSNTFTFALDENGNIFGAKKVTDVNADTNTYAPVYVIDTTAVLVGTNEYGVSTYNFFVQYYSVDGKVHNEAYTTVGGLKVVKSGADAAKGETDYAAQSGWMMLANTANGNALRAVAATDGLETATYTGAADYALTSLDKAINGKLITKDTTFLYSTAAADVNDQLNAANTNAAVVTGAHSSGTIGANAVNMLIKKNASNATMYDVVYAWVPVASPAPTDTGTTVYVQAYNGTYTVAGVPFYSYTVYNMDGTKDDAFVTTTPDASGLKKVTVDANGNKAFDTALVSTASLAAGKATGVYTLDGVNYATVGSNEYIVNDTVVIDLRAAVLAGTVPAINTIAGMRDSSSNLTATIVYTQDQNSVKTAGTIIITA